MKRFFGLLVVLLLIPCLVVAASAAQTSGKCGENLTWVYNSSEKSLTVSGTGKMDYFGRAEETPWYGFRKSAKKIVIEEGVETISSDAFGNFQYVTSVELGEGVTFVGDGAFEECVNLKKVVFPTSLKRVYTTAFSGCDLLCNIYISDLAAWNEVDFGYDSWDDADYVSGKRMYFMDAAKPQSIYLNGKLIKDLVIPAEITKVADELFANTTIESVAFESPETVESLGEYAFYGCYSLKAAEIPSGVDTLPMGVFSFCTGLEHIEIPENITAIISDAFNGCESLKCVEMPDSVADLGVQVFDGCKALTTVEFSDSITSIPRYAFYGCTALKSVCLPTKLQEIDSDAFKDCKNLQEIYIPATVDYIEKYAFSGCTSLTDVYFEGTATGEFRKTGNGDFFAAEWHENTPYPLRTPLVTTANVASSGKPRLSWDAVDGAEKYRIYRATSKSGSFKYLASTGDTTYTDKETRAGSGYYYKVKAVGEDTESFFSGVVNRICDLKRPKVTLKVDTASGKPKVTWEKISGAKKYYIVRSTSENGTYSKVASVTGTSYVDKGAKPGKTYYYKVKALHEKSAADSAYSAVTSRVCDLKKPVVTVSLKSGDPRIRWGAISGAVKYEVYRATSKDGTYKLVKTTKTATSFTDTAVRAGKTYYYKVKAIHKNPDANSAYSTVKSIRAK